jgi:hypothetical protein
MQYQECGQFLLNVMHDNKPNNFYFKHFFIIFQIKKLQRLFDTFVPLGIDFDKTGPASRYTWSRRRASSFCPARFCEAAVFFVDGEERTKRTRLERERKWANFGWRHPFMGKLGPNAARTDPSHWPTNE